MSKTHIVIGFGVVTAGLAYHHYRIKNLEGALINLGDSYIEHLEAEYQEQVDEEFNEIMENYDE